jgi:cell division protein FtsB
MPLWPAKQALTEAPPAAPPAAESGTPVTPASSGPGRFSVSPAQLTVLVVCVVSIFFVANFYGKSMDSYRINQRAAQARRDNARLEQQIELLQEKVEQLSAEGYLETAAREKLNLVKPGDRPIVILPAAVEVATVAGPPPGAEGGRPLAELGHTADWLVLFFGAR